LTALRANGRLTLVEGAAVLSAGGMWIAPIVSAASAVADTPVVIVVDDLFSIARLGGIAPAQLAQQCRQLVAATRGGSVCVLLHGDEQLGSADAHEEDPHAAACAHTATAVVHVRPLPTGPTADFDGQVTVVRACGAVWPPPAWLALYKIRPLTVELTAK
jgi:hypothetical protein